MIKCFIDNKFLKVNSQIQINNNFNFIKVGNAIHYIFIN